LKTQGIDPKTHPVVHELVGIPHLAAVLVWLLNQGEQERVKQYFDKIKEAEDPAKRSHVASLLSMPANVET
jgi:exosome complex protein LRP1